MGRRTTAAGITVLALLSTSIAVAMSTAAAAAPRTPADPAAQTLESATLYGTGTLVGLAPKAAPAAATKGHGPEKTFVHHTSAVRGAALKPTLTTPAPKGTPVARSAGGAFGFNGVSNYDQANAGTGAYAGSQFDLEPPDQGLCAANGYVVEPVNIGLVIYDTKGNALTAPTPLNQFFARSPAFNPSTGALGDFLSDPKCYYDPIGHRFVQTILEIDAPGTFDGVRPADRMHVLIAVSKTANPTGAWNLYSIDTSDDGLNGTPTHTDCPCLPDQPLLGANADGIFIATNEFQNNPNFYFSGAQIYGFGFSGLESGAATIKVPHLNVGAVSTGDASLPWWGSLQPAESISPARGSEMLMSGGPEDVFQNNAPLDNRIAVWSLTGTSSLNSAHPKLALRHTVLTSETYGLTVNTGATQKPGPTPLRDALGDADPLALLNGNDSRMNQVVNVDGMLYSGVNTAVSNPDGSAGIGIAYFSVAAESSGGGVSAEITHQGYVAVTGENVLFPSIAVTRDGTGAMAFTLAGPDYYPSAAYVRFADGRATGPVFVTGAGAAPEDGFTAYGAFGGSGVARWGDYSAAVTDGSTIWMASEYIPGTPRDFFANWGTFVSRISG